VPVFEHNEFSHNGNGIGSQTTSQRTRETACAYRSGPTAGWRRADLCDSAISREGVLPEYAGRLHQVVAQAVTTKELSARIRAGAHKSRLLPCAVTTTRRDDEISVPD
jgi:hypothetical protein